MTKEKQEMMKDMLNGVGVEIGDQFLQEGRNVRHRCYWRDDKFDGNGLD